MARAAKKTTRKSSAKSKAKAKAVVIKKIKTYKEQLTKSELLKTISDDTGVAKKEVASVIESLTDIINGHIKDRALGSFTMPGLLKIEVKKKPATKARKGINPFTGEETIFKAKPARKVVKIKALKKLKDMVDTSKK